MGDHLGNDVCDGGSEHAEGLKPLFSVPDVQDDSLPPVTGYGTSPKLVLGRVEMVPGWPHTCWPCGSQPLNPGCLGGAECGNPVRSNVPHFYNLLYLTVI